MVKCEICGLRDSFRYFKNLEMCIICYKNNINKPRGKEIKANSSDKEYIDRNSKITI